MTYDNQFVSSSYVPFKMSNLYPLEEEIKINPVVYHMRHKSQFK